jgi:putative FmdB family regulatory protein
VPTYEYRCEECGDSFEIFQRMSDDPLVTCEKCGGMLRKVLHPVAIHFKGSGFYTTDYGKGSGRRAGGRDASAEAGESSSEGVSSSGGESLGSEKAPASSATETAKGDGKPREKQKAT